MEEKMFYMDEVNPSRVLIQLLQNLWVAVLLAAAVWFGLSAYEKMNYSPLYTSDATIVVSAKGNAGAYSSLSVASNMAEVFSEVFKSNMLRERVEQQMDGEKLNGYIDTRIVPNTNLMIVSVVSSSPEQAFRALNAVIETYPELTQSMFGNAVLEVINDPRVPRSPSNAGSLQQNKKLGAMAAFVLTVAGICVLTVLRGTVQTPAAAKRRIDAHLLRTIDHEAKNRSFRLARKKRNVAPLFTSHFTSLNFRESNQNLATKLEYHMRKHGQKVILVSSAEENEGKSTVAANLALCLASKDKRVALLDCDFRKPAVHKVFQTRPDLAHDFGSCIADGHIPQDLPMPLPKYGIWVCANAKAVKNPQRLLASETLIDFVQRLRQEFDYVVLDTPPMKIAADAQAAANLADVALLVVREDYTRIRDINDCVDVLGRTCGDVAGFVLNNSLDLFATGKKA